MAEKKNKKIEIDKDATIYGVYQGAYMATKLPQALYESTAEALKEAVYKGYGGTLIDFGFDSPDLNTLEELRTNIYMFSGAKTFQQTSEMSDALVSDEGQVLSFSDFKKEASDIFDRYNEDWLEAEYNTAITTARSASKWADIQANKKDRPYLQYSAAMDEHTCEICRPLDGIISPVDDAIWNGKCCVPQHFNCECTLRQLDHFDADEAGGVWDKEDISDAISKQVGKNKMFNFNAGKDKVIFQDTGKNRHPYFEIPKRYKELAERNFNLPIPKHDK